MNDGRFLPSPRKRDRRPTHETAYRAKVSNGRGPWVHSTYAYVASIENLAKRLLCVEICRKHGTRGMYSRADFWKPNAVTEYAVRHFLKASADIAGPEIALRRLMQSDSELCAVLDSGALGRWTAEQSANAPKRFDSKHETRAISDEEMVQVLGKRENARARRDFKRANPLPMETVGECYRAQVSAAKQRALDNGKAALESVQKDDATRAAIRKMLST